MAENSGLIAIHWARPAATADADQAVAPMLGILGYLRRNQWIVLYREVERQITGYFPFTKRELEDRLIEAAPLRSVSEVLELPQTGSQPLSRKFPKLEILGSGLPELSRLVLIDESGAILGIGVPRQPRLRPDRAAPRKRKSIVSYMESAEFGQTIEAYAEDGITYFDPSDSAVLDFSDESTRNILHSIQQIPPPTPPLPIPVARDNEIIVPIYFGTDRKAGKVRGTNVDFTGQRSPSEEISLGICSVSIPAKHKVGRLEKPTWWKFWSSPTRGEHITLLSTTRLSASDFFGSMRKSLDVSALKSGFIFVHGFNVTFQAAALRTAQLAYDLQFDGVPIMFSWPSKGSPSKYLDDEGSIQWTQPHLQKFLEDIHNQTQAKSVNLIAHSMGNRALLEILTSVTTTFKFDQLVLVAPDVDSGVFAQIAKALPRATDRTTLYASSKDKALAFSKTIHGFRRAGDDIIVMSELDTIDATEADTDYFSLGHSIFAEKRTILTDMFNLIIHRQPPGVRYGLRPRETTHGIYWDFRP